MKKFFTFLTAAVASVVCAQAATVSVVSVDPANGQTVKELTAVRVEFAVDDDAYELELVSSSASLNVKKEGESKTFTYGNARQMGNLVIWTLEKPVTEPGNYVVTIEDGCMEATDYSTWDYVTNSTIALNYTVGAEDEKELKILKTYPEAGSVEELSFITIEFGVPDGYEEISLNTAESMKVTKDGQPFTTGKGEQVGNRVTWELKTPATEPGVYVVTIEAAAIDSWAENPQSAADFVENGTIELIYNIVGANLREAEFSFDPAPGVVESLDVINIKFGDQNPYGQVDTNLTYNVTKNGADFTTATAENNYPESTFTLATPASEPGEYVIYIPAQAISAYDDNWDEAYVNTTTVELKYTIEGTETVAYDLEITKSKPAEGEVNLDDIQFESFILTTSQNAVKVPAGKKIIFASANPDYDFEVELAVKAQMGSNIISFVDNDQIPEYNGAYTLTIPEGTFGDDEWMNNPKAGHTNPEIVLNYTFSGLSVFGVADTLMPTVFAPEATVASLDVVTMTIPGAVKMTEGAKANLSCVETRYDETVDIVAGENGVYTMTFPKAQEYGVYTLVIEKETFFDDEYVETDGKFGATNATISHQWTVGSVGIETVGADAENADIFSLTGVNLGKDAKSLAPGIYVRNGQKIVIK